jgi:L-threonylcarbamoyladenylate synthase
MPHNKYTVQSFLFWFMFCFSSRIATTARAAFYAITRQPRTHHSHQAPSSLWASSLTKNNIKEQHLVMTFATDGTHKSSIRARKVTIQQLDECGARLRAGELVAFPTETVFGLGCDALNEEACQKVFAAKERPLTDPLIVHVTGMDEAKPLWSATASSQTSSDGEARVLETLCDFFWPGPLTLVARASPSVPSILMAGTGFVACRSPSHSIARALLQCAQTPIAAPSANKFGHVSPTRAQHVYDDLKYEDVWIVDTDSDGDDRNDICHVGVESTVAKVEFSNNNDQQGTITVLRQGAVSQEDIAECLSKAGILSTTSCRVVSKTTSQTSENESNVSPGQIIRHYSPIIPSYMIVQERYQRDDDVLSQEDKDALSTAVIIDFGGRIAKWKLHALSYRDLSISGDSSEAAQAVFETLRWAEQVENAKRILFPQVVVQSDDTDSKADALALALHDRLTRAASGVLIEQIDDVA